MQSLASFVARILLCAIFLSSAYGKITNPKVTIAVMEKRGMPAAPVGLPVAVVAETAGGLALLLGYRARWGAALLLVFLIPATLYFHNFWAYPDSEQRNQMVHFMKNITIMGGLLMVVAFGPGGLSFDGRRVAAIPGRHAGG